MCLSLWLLYNLERPNKISTASSFDAIVAVVVVFLRCCHLSRYVGRFLLQYRALIFTEKTRKDPRRPEKTRKDPKRPEKTLIYTEKTRKDALIYTEKTRKDPRKTRKDPKRPEKTPEKTQKDPKRHFYC